jgi:putative GTP pyrophosphokinase
VTEIEEIGDTYKRRYWGSLTRVAIALESYLQAQFQEQPRIDRISARAKSPDRFIAKAAKMNEDGSPKYSAPLDQIQDQLGARIIVFYLRDVPSVSAIVDRYFRSIEVRNVVPDDRWKFGYTGKHFILSLPTDAIPQDLPVSDAPEFFELQIKTLWQHAWSEANHDLGYKSENPLTDDQERRLAFTAAQAWGADRMFDELFGESEMPPPAA